MTDGQLIYEAMSTLNVVAAVKKLFPNDIHRQREKAYELLAGEINIANSETRDYFREMIHEIFQ